MCSKRYIKYYSFADAYTEAIKDNPIKNDSTRDKKLDMDYCRREFRAFLEKLHIVPYYMKRVTSIYPFDPENATVWYNNIKRAPFCFNGEAFELVVDFIKNWKYFEFKEMRRGHFSPQYRLKYRDIIAAVKHNMRSLGYTREEAFHQECIFWGNIVANSAKIADGLCVMDKNVEIQRDRKGNIICDKETKDTELVEWEEGIEDYMAREVLPHISDAAAFFEENLGASSILDFLDLSDLLKLSEQDKEKICPESLLEQEDYIYLNQELLYDWNRFQDKWLCRIRLMLRLRKINERNCDRLLAAGDEFSNLLSAIEESAPHIEMQSSSMLHDDMQPETKRRKITPLDLRNQRTYEESYILDLNSYVELLKEEYVSHRLSNLNLPRPISSSSLCKYVMRK